MKFLNPEENQKNFELVSKNVATWQELWDYAKEKNADTYILLPLPSAFEYGGDGFVYPTGSCGAKITFNGCPTNDAGERLDKRVIREKPYEKIIIDCMYDPEITGKFATDPRYQSVWIDTDLYGRLTLTLLYNIPEKKELDS